MNQLYNYDVFGAIRSSTGAQASEFQFTGEQVDSSTGLEYLRARYYDMGTGRFLSKDPLSARPHWNRHTFAYTESNPVNLVDPAGLASNDCVAGWERCINVAEATWKKLGYPSRNSAHSVCNSLLGRCRNSEYPDDKDDFNWDKEMDKWFTAKGLREMEGGTNRSNIIQKIIRALIQPFRPPFTGDGGLQDRKEGQTFLSCL